MPPKSFVVIREIVPGLRTYSAPFSRFNLIPFGGRSTAVRLSNGDVLVTASTALTSETKASVDELGPVKYLIALDGVHWLYLKEWKTAYANAHVAGVADSEKKSGVKHDGVWGRDPQPLGSDPIVNAEIKVECFLGHHSHDLAVLHVASKTLIEADLLFNMPAKEQYSAPGAPSYKGPFGLLGSVLGVNPWTPGHKSLTWSAIAKDRTKMAYSASVVASWDFQRIIPCHGDVLEEKGNEGWRAAYSKYFDAIAAGTLTGYTPPAPTVVPVNEKSN
ncbi:hypothetical protein BKA62DRAFT_710948 [Auriculariales sp. MPI-PUGE-AT-0066]|nr:hypothetical protein BKA62DRAFT_710948 [Auriculariales sp. MPI-PUGE-AT-0066]